MGLSNCYNKFELCNFNFPLDDLPVNSSRSALSYLGRTWQWIEIGLEKTYIATIATTIAAVFEFSIWFFLESIAFCLEQTLSSTPSLDDLYNQYSPSTVSSAPSESWVDVPSNSKLADRGGFKNDSSSCFMHAVLQALHSVNGFVDHLQTPEQTSNPPPNQKLKEKLRELFAHSVSLKETVSAESKEAVSTEENNKFRTVSAEQSNAFRALVKEFWGSMHLSSQEDAEEFLTHLLEGLQYSTIPCFQTIQRYFVEKNSQKEELYPGQTFQKEVTADTNKYRILQFKQLEEIQDEGDINQLLINNTWKSAPGAFTLTHPLGETKTELLPKDSWTQETIALYTKQEIPELIPVQMCRFRQDNKKLFTPILPPEKLYIPIADQPDKAVVGHLRAVVIHKGDSLRSGHYYSYCRPIDSNYDETRWIKCNDTQVGEVQEEDFPKMKEDMRYNGYLLFYQLHVPKEPIKTVDLPNELKFEPFPSMVP